MIIDETIDERCKLSISILSILENNQLSYVMKPELLLLLYINTLNGKQNGGWVVVWVVMVVDLTIWGLLFRRDGLGC